MKEKQIAERLMQLGFRPDNNGYHYLKTAVQLLLMDNTRKVCKDIYQVIAAKFKTTPSCVERAIRHSIQATYRLDSPEWKKFYSLWYEGGKPTNGWVMATLAEMIRVGEKVAG